MDEDEDEWLEVYKLIYKLAKDKLGIDLEQKRKQALNRAKDNLGIDSENMDEDEDEYCIRLSDKINPYRTLFGVNIYYEKTKNKDEIISEIKGILRGTEYAKEISYRRFDDFAQAINTPLSDERIRELKAKGKYEQFLREREYEKIYNSLFFSCDIYEEETTYKDVFDIMDYLDRIVDETDPVYLSFRDWEWSSWVIPPEKLIAGDEYSFEFFDDFFWYYTAIRKDKWSDEFLKWYLEERYNRHRKFYEYFKIEKPKELSSRIREEHPNHVVFIHEDPIELRTKGKVCDSLLIRGE